MQMRDGNHAHNGCTDRVEDGVGKAIEQEPTQLTVDDRIDGWPITDLRDRRFDLALERCSCALAALGVPQEGGAGLLLRTRIELYRKSHVALPSEDAFTRFRPRRCTYFATLDLSETSFGFLDPGTLDLVGWLADAIEQAKCQLRTILVRQLQGLVEQSKSVGRHASSLPRPGPRRTGAEARP